MVQKLYLLIVAISCVQLCFGAAIPEKNTPPKDSSEELTEEDINNLRTYMASIPGAKNETIEVLTGILNKFKKGASSDEQTEGAIELLVFCFSMGTKNSNLTKEDWNALLNSSEEDTKPTDEAKINEAKANNVKSVLKKGTTESDSSSSELTDADLVEAEKELRTKLSAEETEKIMKILRKFRQGATSDENMEGVMELILYGMSGAFEELLNDTKKDAIPKSESVPVKTIEQNTV